MTKLLIIDDDASFRAWLARMLKTLGYNADVARDGQEALRCLEQKRYGLLLVDLLMPVVSGFEFLETLGRRRMTIPTIIMSAIVVTEVHQYLRTHANVRVLSKPFTELQLQNAIEDLIGRPAEPGPRKKKRRKK